MRTHTPFANCALHEGKALYGLTNLILTSSTEEGWCGPCLTNEVVTAGLDSYPMLNSKSGSWSGEPGMSVYEACAREGYMHFVSQTAYESFMSKT